MPNNHHHHPPRSPFRAALFDLDGTLLDSNGVWHEVDSRFFAARGIADWADFGKAVQGRSFTESAEYAVSRYRLSDSVEAVMAEWMALARDAYAHRVKLKPGALAYLRLLKRAGVKLAVATSNRPELFEPALRAGGALELFDAVCTTAMAGDKGKRSGAVYALAAEMLGVAPSDCAVFEDVLDGILGAKALGMHACALRDPAAAHDWDAMAAVADVTLDSFEELLPAGPEPRCVIFTARCEGDPRLAYAPRADDFVLCADGGWQIAARAGVTPNLILGDFDSSEAPPGAAAERFPVEKDDTDTMLCLKRGLSMGYGEFVIVGGFGGRLDHTLANLQTLLYARTRHARAELTDGVSWARVLVNESIAVPRRPGHLSVFSMGDECRGVTLRGTKYPAEDVTLTHAFPLGVSNSFAADVAEISVEEGALLVMVCGGE